MPLLRIYWNAPKEDTDHRRAFRARNDPDKRSLRRSSKNKANDEENRLFLENFCAEMCEASMLSARLKERELLKLDRLKIESNQF